MKKIITTFRFFNLFLLLKKRKKKFRGLNHNQIAAFASEFWIQKDLSAAPKDYHHSDIEIQLTHAIYEHNHFLMKWKTGEDRTAHSRRSLEDARKKLETLMHMRQMEMDAKVHPVELKREKVNLRKKKK